MATKGRTTVGASQVNLESRLAGRLETFVAGDEITSVSVYTEVTDAAKNVQAALYDASNGSRLALGTAQSNGIGTGWVEIPLSYTVSSVTDIVIAVQMEGGAGSGNAYFDTNSAVTSYRDASANYSYPPPATWSGSGWGTDTDQDLSIYATYTEAGGGGGAPRFSRHLAAMRRRS